MAQNWLALFKGFINQLRVQSKEAVSEDQRGAKLELWGSQRRFLEEVCKGLEEGVRTFYCLKARQEGISTITLAITLFWLAKHPNMSGAVVIDSEGNSQKFRFTLTNYMASLPERYIGKSFKVLKNNKNQMTFSNGSNIDFLVAGTKSKSTWAESRAYNFALVSEVSKFGSEAGLSSFRESLAEHHPNRLYIYESTAFGFNHWYNMWNEAGRDTLTIRRMFIGWWAKEINSIKRTDKRWVIYGQTPPDERERELIDEVKKRYDWDVTPEQLCWYRWRAADESSDDQSLKQNLPWIEDDAFVMSGYSFFQARLIQQDMQVIIDPSDPIMFKGYRYYVGNDFFSVKTEQITEAAQIHMVELRVWEEPVPEGRYVIGMDTAWGRNDWADRTAISVWRCYADRLVQVAEYSDSNVETHQAAWIFAHLAGAYRNCIVNLELTGGSGKAVMKEFDDLRDRLRSELYEPQVSEFGWEDFLSTAQWYLYHKPDSMGAGYVKAWSTTFDTKFEMMNQLRDSYSTRLMVVRSAPMLEEMLTIVQEGGSIGAPGRQKDDRTFAAGLANRAWIDHVRPAMIAAGDTYEAVTKQELGEVSPAGLTVSRIVGNFFRRQAELEEEEPELSPEQQFLADHGFVE